MTSSYTRYLNLSAYYQPIANEALSHYGVSATYRNAAKHALTTSDLSSENGVSLTLTLGLAVEAMQQVTGHDTVGESVKDLTNNVVGAFANKFLQETLGRTIGA